MDSETEIQHLRFDIYPASLFESERGKIRAEAAAALANVPTAITDHETYQNAVAMGRILQLIQKMYMDVYKPPKMHLDKQKQMVLDQQAADVDPVTEAKERLGAMVLAWEKAEAKAKREEEVLAMATRSEDGELPMPSISPTHAAVKGKIERTKWKATVTDLPALVGAVANKLVPIHAIKADQSWLDKRADTDRESLAIPGVTAFEEKKVHFRS